MTVNASTPTTSTTPTTSATRSTGSTLGEQDFLKLLTAQLKYQDPMSPTDTNSFVQEQAQFSTVEGINNLQKSIAQLLAAQQDAQAVSLIGKQVFYTGSDGAVANGVVTGVDESNGSPMLQVGSDSVDPSTVVGVTAAATSTTTTGGSTGA